MSKQNPSLVEVLFHGPAHALEAFGQTVKRGESAFFQEPEIFALQAETRIQIEVLGPSGQPETNPAAPEPEAAIGEGQPAHEPEQEE